MSAFHTFIVSVWFGLLLSLSAGEPGTVHPSPDGKFYIGWFDHDAGKPFGLCRSVTLRGPTDPHDYFSFVTTPRNTQITWNKSSTRCILSDAPDNGGPTVWSLVRDEPTDTWKPVKIDPFTSLYAEFKRTAHGATLYRPSILKMIWDSETVVLFQTRCNLGEFEIALDVSDPTGQPTSRRLSKK